MKIDHKSDLTSGLPASVEVSHLDQQKLTLQAKRPYIREPYKWARVYCNDGSFVGSGHGWG